jgi:hypothetical protein
VTRGISARMSRRGAVYLAHDYIGPMHEVGNITTIVPHPTNLYFYRLQTMPLCCLNSNVAGNVTVF